MKEKEMYSDLRQTYLLGIKINPLTGKEAAEKIIQVVEDQKEYSCRPVLTPNAEILVQACREERLAYMLNNAWLTLPDGSGLKIASKLLPGSENLPDRVAGIDLLKDLIRSASGGVAKMYFLGGRPGVAASAAHRMQERFDNLKILGCHHGYLNRVDAAEVIEDINTRKPDLLFVGMGAPRQEEFIFTHREDLKVKVAITVGGSFDVLSGRKKRAPGVMQKFHLEWLYRIIQEPSRWRRALRLPVFTGIVLKECLRSKFGRN